MANGFPIRNMRQTVQRGQAPQRPQMPPPAPSPPPAPEPEAAGGNRTLLSLLRSGDGLHADKDTLLLLALLWLLWRDRADEKLLLALIYILL